MSCHCGPGQVCGRHGGERPDVAACFHCSAPLDESYCFEGIGELWCSTLCFTAVATYNHGEDCRRGECSEAAEAFTLPAMICAYCPRETTGDTAHETCRQRVKNAFAYQAGARMGARA